MHPALSEAADPTLSIPALVTDLTPLLRRIFWLVHTTRTWSPQNPPSGPDHPALFILAAAPFHEWKEVARQIQDDLNPQTWRIERKENNGLPARTLIFLRKSSHNYQVEILPLRGFKPARFFYDYQRGELLQALLKSSPDSSALHLNPNGLYFENKLVITNPPHLAAFFGLAAKSADTACTPSQLYSELVESPFFNPALFHDAESPTQTHEETTEPPGASGSLEAFKLWLKNSATAPLLPTTKSPILKPQIEERIHCINSGVEPQGFSRP